MALMVLSCNGEEIARTCNEREARRRAREHLGCPRVSEYVTEVGWVYYPTGDMSDDGAIVEVVIK